MVEKWETEFNKLMDTTKTTNAKLYYMTKVRYEFFKFVATNPCYIFKRFVTWPREEYWEIPVTVWPDNTDAVTNILDNRKRVICYIAKTLSIIHLSRGKYSPLSLAPMSILFWIILLNNLTITFSLSIHQNIVKFSLVTGDYNVFSVARKWLPLADHFRANQSARVKSSIHLCGIFY